jgi:3-dehydroquinate synthase
LSAEPEIVHVSLGDRSYDIVIGADLLRHAGDTIADWCERPAGSARTRSAAVITDSNVMAHAERVCASLAAAEWNAELMCIEPGEGSKCLAAAAQLYDRLVDMKADRRTPVVAVGGGVIGDLAGFVASTFNRGMPFIQIPTTLLADVDSSVGGKVGVNHPRAKNLIGAFHQPLGVLIDTDCLASLGLREYRSGLAEVVKYGVILDAEFFDWLEGHAELLVKQETRAVRQAISRSCRLKADIVEKDEYEQTGLRAVLNFGHTFAHAFEALAGYGELLHGEAVSIGMVCASRLAERLGRIPSDVTRRQESLLTRCGLPTEVPLELRRRGPELLERMRLDKKSIGGKLRFVLPAQLGAVESVDGVADGDVLAAIG